MLSAICVRKTGDSDKSSSTLTSSLALQGHHGSSKETISSSTSSTTKKKLRGFKVVVGKKSSLSVKEKEPLAPSKEDAHLPRVPPPVKVQDDEDGHLIYHKGDFLDSRCKNLYNYREQKKERERLVNYYYSENKRIHTHAYRWREM